LLSFGAEYLSSTLLSKNTKIKIHRTTIMPVDLYGYKTWSPTLREERSLRVRRRIFGANRDEMKRDWGKLHNEELIDLYSSPNIIRVINSRRMRWTSIYHVWGRRVVHTGFWWGVLRENRLGRTRLRWEDKIKMVLQEVGYGGTDWINLAQDRDTCRGLVKAVMKLRFVQNMRNFLIS
jgi:hypothetical protein